MSKVTFRDPPRRPHHPGWKGTGQPSTLIVDDDPDLRETLCKFLSRASFNALSADNGKAALKAIAESSVDLLIIDIFLPDMDGLEVIQAVCRSHPATKIIAISGEGIGNPQNTLKMALALGADASMGKPFRPADLAEVARKLLAHPGHLESTPKPSKP